jgi:fatty acid synthase subunit alpha, fungi type/fatty acid synthase subunit beta, fungi type
MVYSWSVEPPKCLGSEVKAKTWFDTIIAAYAQQAGISLSSVLPLEVVLVLAVINSEEFIKFHKFARHQVELYMCYLDVDPHEGVRTANKEK